MQGQTPSSRGGRAERDRGAKAGARRWLAAFAGMILAATGLPGGALSQALPADGQNVGAVAESGRPAEFRAGAARVEITPAADALPAGFEGVEDPLYVRAIVVANGTTLAALVTVDAGAISTATWSNVADQAERVLGIPRDHLILTATHTHSAPRMSGPDYEARILEAMTRATGRLQPARIAYGVGESFINVNRNLIDPTTRRWWEGPNRDGVSDKTVAVMHVSDLQGAPIAIFYNYAVHAVIAGQLDRVSGDIPGAASRYIEAALGDDVVAVWSEGAAGDQNPVYFQQTYDLREIRIADYARRGEDIRNAMPPGGQGLDRADPRVALLMEQQRQMMASMGQMLGEEVLHVSRANLERPTTSSLIAGSHGVFSCPGRRRTDSGRAGYPGAYVDAEPVAIRLSLLVIGDVAIGGVDAEVFNAIAQRFKRGSPLKHTMMATLTNGLAASGYVPSDAAFGYNTFEVLSSRLKPGCAESAIVEGLLDQLQPLRLVWNPD